MHHFSNQEVASITVWTCEQKYLQEVGANLLFTIFYLYLKLKSNNWISFLWLGHKFLHHKMKSIILNEMELYLNLIRRFMIMIVIQMFLNSHIKDTLWPLCLQKILVNTCWFFFDNVINKLNFVAVKLLLILKNSSW